MSISAENKKTWYIDRKYCKFYINSACENPERLGYGVRECDDYMCPFDVKFFIKTK